MFRFTFVVSALVSLACLPAIRPAFAAWPHDPNNGNVPVCTAAGTQSSAQNVPDGAGGTIVAWADARGAGTDVYVQRLSAAGVPLWTANGVAVCTAANTQQLPAISPDGTGGAIIAWQDNRSGTSNDIYAQRVNAAGVVQWAADGLVISAAANEQLDPAIVADGSGGAIVTWTDNRGGSSYDIYAQRVSAAGTRQWTTNGIAICASGYDQLNPVIAQDGAGGAIVAWQDNRSGTGYDIYAQRVGVTGAVQWALNGVGLCVLTGVQQAPRIVADGAGGAIVTWFDARSGTVQNIYAQRISAAGAAQWTANGAPICTATGGQINPVLASDDAGGAIISWSDSRNGPLFDIYAQRIAGGGAPLWAENGVAVSTAAGHQMDTEIVSDGGGGAIIVWYDFRGAISTDIYAQRVSATGVMQWTTDGVAVSTAPGHQLGAALASDGAGGAVVVWEDARSGGSDIYAQRVERYGQLGNPEPAITSVSDVRSDQGGFVKLTWSASYLDADPAYGITEYRVFRSVPGPFAAAQALRRGTTDVSDVAVRDGRLLVRPAAGTVTSWEYVGTQAAETFPLYSRVVSTPCDSVGGSNPRTWFMVEARATTSLSGDRWFSAPDSGYSVDNLPPAAPAPFTGQYSGGVANLHWDRNSEPDLAGYRLYRGTSLAFTPSPASLLVVLPDADYADVAGAPYVYKLTAVDVHGNESPVAVLAPGGTTEVGEGAPRVLSFQVPSPNPARGAATLDYTLSRTGHVRLCVYDAAGRRVRVLRDGELAEGAHRVSFALRDEAGHGLAAGLYLVRLEAEGRVLTRRLAAIR